MGEGEGRGRRRTVFLFLRTKDGNYRIERDRTFCKARYRQTTQITILTVNQRVSKKTVICIPKRNISALWYVNSSPSAAFPSPSFRKNLQNPHFRKNFRHSQILTELTRAGTCDRQTKIIRAVFRASSIVLVRGRNIHVCIVRAYALTGNNGRKFHILIFGWRKAWCPPKAHVFI